MESLNLHNIKLEKANAILRNKKRQRVTTLFRFIEFCIFLVVISRYFTQLPLTFKLSTDYFKGVGVTLVSPRFVFVLANAIVIILFLISGQSSANDGSTSNVKIDLHEQKYPMNKEAYCEQIKKQSILAERRVEKGIHRSHSDNSICLSRDEKKSREKLIRSATVGCLKGINTDSVKKKMTATSYPADGLSSEEFRKTVENFIARQQRLLREEEFSALVSV